MLNEVYNRRILELAGGIPRLGRLEKPDASATAHSKLCGSTVTVDLKMDGDTVTDFAHEVKACALGQASSSIMASHVVGAKADELRKLRDTVRKMLKENGATPKDGKWDDIAVLEPVRDYKARHPSTMLTFDAVVDAIGQIEGKRQRAAGRPAPGSDWTPPGRAFTGGLVVAGLMASPPAWAQGSKCTEEAASIRHAESQLPRLAVAPPEDQQIVCITLETNILFARRIAAHLAHCPRSP